MAIDFLTIGHITHDRTPDGFRMGGTVSYAAVTARRMGRKPAILTSGTPEQLFDGTNQDISGRVTRLQGGVLDDVGICLLPSSVTTTFRNIYEDGRRTQVLEALAEPIFPEALPPAWADVPIVLLGPLVREVPSAWISAFPKALMGVTPQGWMRRWDGAGHVSPSRWENAADFLDRADVVSFSREDVGGDEAYLDALAKRARLMVVTDGWRGVTVYQHGATHQVPPRPTREVEPTGAGDVFAAAFLIRLAETGAPLVAARFANVVASMSVEAIGIAGIPSRQRVDAWLSGESV